MTVKRLILTLSPEIDSLLKQKGKENGHLSTQKYIYELIRKDLFRKKTGGRPKGSGKKTPYSFIYPQIAAQLQSQQSQPMPNVLNQFRSQPSFQPPQVQVNSLISQKIDPLVSPIFPKNTLRTQIRTSPRLNKLQNHHPISSKQTLQKHPGQKTLEFEETLKKLREIGN